MIVGWQNLIIKVSIWLFLEVFLNWLGWDTLADYGEFILEGKMLSLNMYHSVGIELLNP